MSVFDDVKPKEKAQTFKRAEFFNIKLPGNYVIRVLEVPVLTATHFVNSKYPVRCLGEDCPICENNRKLRNANPKVTDLREIRGYVSRTERYMLNVLDRTPVKTCPNCQTEHYAIAGQFPPLCTCGTPIMNEKPHKCDRVKVMAMPIDKADSIRMIEKAVLNSEGNPVGLENFDLILLSSMENKKIKWTPMPDPNGNDKIEIPEDALTPQQNFAINLNRDEIINLLKGAAIKDIFLARGSQSATASVSSAVNPEVQKQLDDIFDGLKKG